ncbi:MAG: restriction endonuclease subunit S [Colwellia sp.]|nr:restriction endonuclease subunit S [Colwellia sp.]
MLPNGWEKGVVEDIAKVSSGGTPSRQNESYWLGGQVPWVTTTEVKLGIITNTEQKITEEGLKNSSAKLFPKDTILMAMYGQGKTRGQVAKLGIEASTNQACAALQLNEGFEVDYYYQYLISQYENIRDLANSGGQQNLSGGIIKGIHVPIPPLPEQRKIAKILGTWDKAISTTERLIDSSKQQKKALMQQLLKGKKRLFDQSGKPFEGEWEKVKLDDVVLNTQLGTSERTKDIKESSVIPLIKMGNLTWGGFNFNKLETIPKSIVDNNLILQHGDFLFNTRNTPDLVGKSAVWKGQLTEVTFDNNINRITFDHSVNTDFICFYLTHGKGKSTINSLPAGSTSVAAIYWKNLKNIKVPLPVISEQTKIIFVLNNADQEIKLLAQQLADLKQEKKALMQQLLTGKRRVKTNDTESPNVSI